ncbi:poly(A)-specific ribonuclease PNLDC1-like [Protopterus annectens]|uniref:poly(A)-specific ribonuclease PNLDC1-like n=1 Tax=Protopterus annectens TaxID=7888 RepID=UPI001CFBAAE5|nr:poly(A)-specific ribonuclease PNLDC1-like [Protopterus annectens]
MINVIRGRMSRMCLKGPDLPARRPPLLLVRAHRILCVSEIYHEFRVHWSLDVRKLTKYKFLLSVNTFKGVRAILKTYWKHPELCVTTYRYWQHASNIVCMFHVCSVVAAWSILAFILGGCRSQK